MILSRTGCALLLAVFIDVPECFAFGITAELDVQAGLATNRSDSLDAFSGERNHSDEDFRLRLKKSWESGAHWRLNATLLTEARHGGSVVLKRKQYADAPNLYIDPQRRNGFRFNHSFSDSGRHLLTQRIDRLTLSYSDPEWVVRVGRQALTWGTGLVFHPLDLLNPFPPNATDTRYKPGADMIYTQRLFASGADIQAVLVPRRNPVSSAIETRQSASGVKWHGFLGSQLQFGVDLLLARDYQADTLALALSGMVGGSSWSVEALSTKQKTADRKNTLLMNIQYAWVWAEKNYNGYLEFFHSGFGVTGSEHTLDNLPVTLVERFSRGQVFTLSKNYLALGANIQWTARLTLKPLMMNNLNDRSVLWIGQAAYNLSQNTSLTVGIQWGMGKKRSEYGGGLKLSKNVEIFARIQNRIYARFSWYF